MKKSLAIILVLLIMGFISVAQQQKKGYIDTGDDIRLHYRVSGSGSDTIVVADGSWIYPYIEEFGNGLTWIVYDVRNRGYSDNTDNLELISMEYEIADLEKVRQYFKLDRMNILGWSYLGGMAALYAAKYPEYVNSIIQVGPIPLKAGEHWNYFLQDKINRADTVLDNHVKHLQKQDIDKTDPELFCKEFWKAGIAQIIYDKAKLEQLTDKVPCDCENEWPQNLSSGQIFEKLGQWDWTDKVKSIQAKSLVIHGMADNIPYESSENWARLIPNSRIFTMNHSGHMPMAEEPEIFFDAVKKFIQNEALETESGFAEVNGTKLYYEVAGSGEPLVLVHGNFGDCRHWDFNFEELLKNFKVVRFDVRGYGKSDSSPKGLEYKDHDDLKALMDFLEIPKANIAGFSMGSGIIINFGLEYPDMCKSLIPVGPWVCGYSPPSIHEFGRDFGRLPTIIKQGGTDAAAEQFIKLPLFKSHNSTEEVNNYIIKIAKDYSFLHFIGEGPTRIEPDAVNMLNQIKVPVLIVTSEFDINSCLEVANLLDEKVVESKLINIPASTHFMMMDKPEEFNKELIGFIKNM